MAIVGTPGAGTSGGLMTQLPTNLTGIMGQQQIPSSGGGGNLPQNPYAASGLPQFLNPNQFTYNNTGTPGAYSSNISGLPSPWSLSSTDAQNFAPGMQNFNLTGSYGPGYTSANANYALQPDGTYKLSGYNPQTKSDAGSLFDKLTQGATMATMAAASALSGGSMLGMTGDATSLFGGSNPLFGAGAGGTGGFPGGMQLAGDLPASDVGGTSGLGTLTGAPGGSIPTVTAGADAGQSVAGLGSAAMDSSMGPPAGLAGGMDASMGVGGFGPPGVLGGAQAGTMGAPGGVSGFLSSLVNPNSGLNALAKLGIGGINALGNNRASNNLTNTYNSQAGLQGPSVNALNSAIQNPAGLFGPGGPLSGIMDVGQRQIAASMGQNGTLGNQTVNSKLLNDYMMQNYMNYIQSLTGAAGTMTGNTRGYIPPFTQGTIMQGNVGNPLASLFGMSGAIPPSALQNLIAGNFNIPGG